MNFKKLKRVINEAGASVMESFRGYKFSKCGKLVLGFLIIHDDQEETRYAIHSNGMILQSTKRPYSHNFVQRGEKWSIVKSVPDHAEFIGNYPKPI